jgi:hypothetical protein
VRAVRDELYQNGESNLRPKQTLQLTEHSIVCVRIAGTRSVVASPNPPPNMTNNTNNPDECTEDSVGTNCAVCDTEISPNRYPQCRAILVNESDPEQDQQSVKLVCRKCWTDLKHELSSQDDPETPLEND